MRSRNVVSLVAAAVIAAVGGLDGANVSTAAPLEAQGKALGKSEHTNSVYIVRMADAPVVGYDGGIKGYAATKPRKGQKIDPTNPNVEKYFGYLAGKHDQALQNAGGAKKLYSYGYVYNGFAAELTEAQVAKLRSLDGVLSVEKDEARPLDTATTPAFLGLDAPGGLWDQLGGVDSAGEGIIIGIVDGGVWPEHPSFSDRTGANGNNTKDGKLSYQQIPGWHGKCTPGEQFTASDCNQKLIGARYYNSGWGGNAGIDADLPWEFNSPRDFGGHGTHTATTAGGNHDVTITGLAAPLGKMSGIAPRARIAAYKVCWETGSGGSCFNSDSVAAIDQAVADGVDVINFSISGTRTNFLDAVEVAFLFAADAGVFVAASAGNSGPASATVAHPSPWITTVAAGTHDRYYEAEASFGDGSSYVGASVNQGGVTSSPFIYAEDAAAAGVAPADAARCFADTLDPAKVGGKIVLCDRGVIARVDKSAEVARAGGIGMIHANTGPSSLNADFHSVPTVHVDHIAGAAIRAYVDDNGSATASIAASVFAPVDAPFTASFSSRGPLLAGGGDVLKPDLIAPGQDVMAGVAPPGNGGELFASYSGTSMSSPHVAGLAALLKDLHPSWSPMMIKSALMTTGYDVLDGGTPAPNTNPILIFRQGAGHVSPAAAADPGLVFDHGFIDWLGFLCGTGQLQAGYCPAIGIDPSDLNVPSIAIGALPGTQTVTRTATNVSGKTATFTATVNMPGFSVGVSPSTMTLKPGESGTFAVSITANTAPLNSYGGGQLTWTSDQGHSIRLPIVAQPISIAAPSEVSGSGVEGSATIPVTFGYTGDYTAAPHGLEPAVMTAGTVEDDPGNSFAPFGPGTTLHFVSVPAGQAYARFSLFDDYTDGNDDLDLYVYYPSGAYAGGSGSGTSAEQVDVLFPPAGDYYVFVHGWQTDGPDANYTLFSWSFSATPGSSNLTLTAPSSATQGATEDVVAEWSGLDAGTKYLGAVSHSDADSIEALTLISVSTD